jgi:peptide-methionine (R)-S-oxide reductase
LALYPSKTKFDSGTGWPSFWKALPRAVGTMEDNSFFSRRTEVHCRRCGSHLGHIFDDGPAPTGKRHCLNGVSLVFKSA